MGGVNLAISWENTFCIESYNGKTNPKAYVVTLNYLFIHNYSPVQSHCIKHRTSLYMPWLECSAGQIRPEQRR